MRNDDLREMARELRLASVPDAGFGMFREMLRYKLARQGKALILVDRYQPTSRTCSVCGLVRDDEAPCRRRTWTCPRCGTVHNREVNAAKNIKAQGLARYFSMQEREAA